MALTNYQLQYKRRMKKALALRTQADRKARNLAARLVAALTDGETAANHISRINALYGTALSQRTDLVDGFRQAGTAAGLTTVSAASLGGYPAVLYANVANANNGAALAGDVDLD